MRSRPIRTAIRILSRTQRHRLPASARRILAQALAALHAYSRRAS